MNKYHAAYSHKYKCWCIYESVGPGIHKVIEKDLDNRADAEFYIEIIKDMRRP